MKQQEIKTIYIKSPTPAWMDVAAYLQETYRFKPVLWISSTPNSHKECLKRFPDATIFSHFDAMKALGPPGLKKSNRCVDADFLAHNAYHEDIFYNMMDRWCGSPEKISMEKRRAYYIDMANTWFAIFEALAADLVLVPTVPHRLYDYMAYVVARYSGIPFIMLDQSNEILIDEDSTRKTLFYHLSNLEGRAKIIQDNMNKTRKPSSDLQRYLDITLADYETVQPLYFKTKYIKTRKPLWLKLRAFFRNNIPFPLRLPVHALVYFVRTKSFYTNKLVFPYRTREGQKTVKFQNIISGLRRHDRIKKRTAKAKQWYMDNCTEPDLSRKFIYFAPSFQPERSSTPDSGLCQWVELMIEIIANAMPDSWTLYYKEHPSNYREPITPDNNRSVSLYERLKHLAPMIEFVPIDYNPLNLIDAAQCVATSTGTSGWQAISRGVPTLVFGETWYTNCPGAFYISSTEQCKDALKKIENGYKPDQKQVIEYLCALETVGGSYDWARGYRPYEPEKLEQETQRSTVKDFCDDIYEIYAGKTGKTLKAMTG